MNSINNKKGADVSKHRNVISFLDKKEEKERKIKMREAERDKELKRKRTFSLTLRESQVLFYSYIEYIKYSLDIIDDESLVEDKQDKEEEIKRCIRLVKRLFKKIIEARPYEVIKMSWSYINLYDTIVAFEIASLDALDDEELYENKTLTEKVQNHLYYKLNEADNKRLKIIDPSLYNLYNSFDQVPEMLKMGKLKIDNIRNINEHKYVQEFENKIVLIEESNLYFGDSLVLEKYYVHKYPKGYRKYLNQLVREENAECCCKGLIEFNNDIVPNSYSFPPGYRIIVNNEEELYSLKAFENIKVEVISFFRYNQEEGKLDWETMRMEDLVDEITFEWECRKSEGSFTDFE
ncbi:hypothetical protein [Priestia aryabhattai]